MKKICLYFQVHQPFRLRNYRFFDIGESSNYFDDLENKYQMQKIAKNCYMPANKILLELIRKYKNKFKVSFSITGAALEQFEEYTPEVLNSFQKLAKTGNVEFLTETYSHSLVSLTNKNDFKEQVNEHSEKIQKLFNQKPGVFRNTELIYNNEIGETIAELGYKAVITEGAKHILGWKSPNLLYYNVLFPELKIILRNNSLSDDISFRFSNQTWDEYPLTADKYTKWLVDTDKNDEVINLFMGYETFGEHHKKGTGIFDFLKTFPESVFNNSDMIFSTPSEIYKATQPVAPLNVPNTISWADKEKDITAWLGNDLQNDAFDKLSSLSQKMKVVKDTKLQKDWRRLQTNDHFYYMSTKILSDGIVQDYFNPYKSAYDAFINYMNVLSDFTARVGQEYKKAISGEESEILKQIKEHEEKLKDLKSKLNNKPKSIEKEKPKTKVISKTRKESKPISKSKKVSIAIYKTKKELKKIKKK